MARRTSSSRLALLGLLTIEPMSGYDVGRMVRASIGHIWSESYGQIYPTLKNLAAHGLAKCKTETHKGRPDRHIYSITTKGREQLAKWLSVPPQPEIPRNEMLLKLFFGAQVPAHILIANVLRMVEEHRALLQKLTRVEHEEIDENQHYPDAPFWKMAARYGQIEMEAHLKWAEETLRTLRMIAPKKIAEKKIIPKKTAAKKSPAKTREEKNHVRS
jgi:DNA-binding PadR family transcriptional regulator